jgi:lysophospholipase L1-like esterase
LHKGKEKIQKTQSPATRGQSSERLCELDLNREFGVSKFVKPRAKTSDIFDTYSGKDMTKDDTVVVCAGSNDISKNNAKDELKNIINFVRRTNHTNIIVLETLHRHDLVEWSCVNKGIRIFNRLLAKRLKSYKHGSIRSANLGRQHFTRHGLHINYKGKKEICH